MDLPLQHLLDDDYIEAFEPPVQRVILSHALRQPLNSRDELRAKADTTAALLASGMKLEINDDEESEAIRQFHREQQQLPLSATNNPAIILKLSALMSEYDHEVVRDAVQMRQYVTNRLLEESDPNNKKVPAAQRLAALKLLGQITEVGLFTERTEITVKSMPVETLEAKLHDKLKVLLPEEYEAIEAEARAA
jgi:hypothetical protein